MEVGKDVVEIRKRLVEALSVADETYSKWTRNVREEYDKEIQSQIISEYLKAELTQEQVADKFGYKQAHIVGLRNRLLQKVNLLFSLNPQDFFENLPKKIQDKVLFTQSRSMLFKYSHVFGSVPLSPSPLFGQ